MEGCGSGAGVGDAKKCWEMLGRGIETYDWCVVVHFAEELA